MLTAALSALTALVTVVVTNFFTRRREHEADWRKLKLAQYQQLIVAFSGIEKSRYTPETVRQFTDAVNALALIASPPVLRALQLISTRTHTITSRALKLRATGCLAF
jgi:Zn-dependent protease with chaperone function